MLKKSVHVFGKALRETGQALDRVALRIVDKHGTLLDVYSRHRKLMHINNKSPLVALDSFVAPNATVVGNVHLGEKSSVWYGAVVRGDRNHVSVGSYSNVQDKATINTNQEFDSSISSNVDVGSHVTIGHGAVLNSCVVKDNCVIGMNAVIAEGCVVEKSSMVAAGSVLLPNTIVPSGQLWAGNPAVYVRDVTEKEIASFEKQALQYADLAAAHAEEYASFENGAKLSAK